MRIVELWASAANVFMGPIVSSLHPLSVSKGERAGRALSHHPTPPGSGRIREGGLRFLPLEVDKVVHCSAHGTSLATEPPGGPTLKGGKFQF